MSRIKGRVLKLGDDVNTDLIIPGHYLSIHDPTELARHIFEDLEIDLPATLAAGCNLVLAGINFGSGSSREQAVTGLKAAGFKGVVAKSFGRIFYRNAINEGVPVIECPEAYGLIASGDEVEIDLERSEIRAPHGTFSFPPASPSVRRILRMGGLTPYLKDLLAREKGGR